MSTQPQTIDEVFDSLFVKIDFDDRLKDRQVQAATVLGKEEAKAALSAMVAEIRGDYEPHIIVDTGVSIDSCDSYKTGNESDCNCPAGERNQLRREFDQRAIAKGFDMSEGRG